MRSLVALVLLATSGSALAQPVGPPSEPEIWSEHFLYGYPTGTPITNDLLIRDLYALSSNDGTRFADWVAYRLTVDEVGGASEAGDFERRWRPDPWLDATESLDPDPPGPDDDPYTGTGYDRGHLAPLAAFVGATSVPTVNLYSNIAPQRPALNRGPWASIERSVRALVLRRADRTLDARPPGHRGFPQPDDRAAVWVLSGTLYERPMDSLRTARPHIVPSGFWTVVAVIDGWEAASVRAAAFVFDQDAFFPAPLSNLTTIDEIEARSGLDLFRLLPDAIEADLEGGTDATEAAALLFPDD